MITGSTGNIGTEIIRQLSNSNSDITFKAAVHSEGNRVKNDNDLGSVQQVKLDFNTPESIADSLKEVDKLFVLTPTHPKMVDFTTNLINAAKDVKHIVKFSHIRADAQPGITITRLRRQAEKVIEESGIPYTFLRPNFMQNFVNLYGQMIRDTDSFSLAAGDGKVSFVDIRDIGSVAATVLTEQNDVHIGKSYDLKVRNQ